MHATFRVQIASVLFLSCIGVLLGARLNAPSALQRFDQPKTVSYTADILVNGRWLLPRDMLGHPATKPPLVNWMAAPVVALGFWTELAVKWPMMLGTIITAALAVRMAHRLFRKIPETREMAQGAACVAGIACVVNSPNLTMIYHCRPDPVLVAFLTLAWILGTKIVCDREPANALEQPLQNQPSPGASRPPLPSRERIEVRVSHSPRVSIVAAFWIAVGLAALTKGPAALVPIIYLPLAARLIGGRWSLVQRSRWWWGLLLALGIFCAWAVPTALRYPDPFFRVLIGKQLIAPALGMGEQFGATQFTSRGPIVALELIWENPKWFLERFAPWSLVSIGGLCVIGWRRWFRHPLAPAVLWTFLVLAFFALSAHKTADYILPAYPAAAILAAYFCATFLNRFRIRLWQVALAGLLLAIGLTFGLSRDPAGDNLKIFARDAGAIVRDDPVVFVDTGFNTLQFFLHRHQGGDPTPEQIERAKWVIMPVLPDVDPELRSQLVPRIQEKRFVLGLYRIETVRARL
jgi:4-amino-4-deoxy-L-arabinose transferase-like glycosyltransferase